MLTCPFKVMLPPAVMLTTPPLTVTPPSPLSSRCSVELILFTSLIWNHKSRQYNYNGWVGPGEGDPGEAVGKGHTAHTMCVVTCGVLT